MRTGADGADPSVLGQLDATSEAVPAQTVRPVPRAGVLSPGSHSTPYVRSGLDLVPTGAAEPLRNAFRATLTNLSAATLDTDRMRLDPRRPVTGSITSDGPAVLVLTGVERRVTVTLDGRAVPGAWRDGVVRVPLGAGTVVLVLS